MNKESSRCIPGDLSPEQQPFFWRRLSELIRFTALHRPVNLLSNERKSSDLNNQKSIMTGETAVCKLCFAELPVSLFTELSKSCSHSFCTACLKYLLTLAITESRVVIDCPLPGCNEKIHPNDIYRLIDDPAIIRKYEKFMVRRVLQAIPDTRWCPAPDCGFAFIASGCASCPKLFCLRPGCNTSFCYHCKQKWHPNQTCEDAARKSQSVFSDNLSTDFRREEIKKCPCCKAMIIKMEDGSCNHMTCSVCGTEFCWLCMKVITDLHYLSPSGCTFWGKKQWSRKKKIFWQCLTLLGAPVGIALIASVSIPAIMIGLPIWASRKVYRKLMFKSRRKRNVAVMLAACATVIIAPIIACIFVVIGIPVLLTFAYGVIPISLCRGDGCWNVSDVNIDNFSDSQDDENDLLQKCSYSTKSATTYETTKSEESFSYLPRNQSDIPSEINSAEQRSTRESLRALAGSIRDASLFTSSLLNLPTPHSAVGSYDSQSVTSLNVTSI